MRIRTVERFTVQIVKTHHGPLENVGYFADAESAKLWGQALIHTHQAISARVLRMRWVERPGVGVQLLDDAAETVEADQ